MSKINTNVNALTATNALTRNSRDMQQTMQRLSTGQRINGASDDAAGIAIATTMTAQINGLNAAVKNANDAMSMLQTADGALSETSSLVQRMRELAVLAINDTYSSTQKSAMSTEFTALASQITSIATTTQWNGLGLLNGSAGGGTGNTSIITFQVGGNTAQTMTVTVTSMGLGALSLTTAGIGAAASATSALPDLDTALTVINTARATLGASINRLTHAVDNLSNVAANATESRSKITDTDYAQATSDLARQQIIQQAGTAMLAQANQMPSMVLALLR
ncbi:flagellin [Burkholderiaceae bacterium]